MCNKHNLCTCCKNERNIIKGTTENTNILAFVSERQIETQTMVVNRRTISRFNKTNLPYLFWYLIITGVLSICTLQPSTRSLLQNTDCGVVLAPSALSVCNSYFFLSPSHPSSLERYIALLLQRRHIPATIGRDANMTAFCRTDQLAAIIDGVYT